MASQTIDRVQVEIEATAKGTSAVFQQLESQLKTLKSALNAVDTSKLSQAQTAAKNISVNTSGMTKAERDITNSVNKIKEALAGLNAYKNAALSGDSSSLTSFNRRVISIQSSIDVLKQKIADVGDTNVPTAAFSQLETQIEATKARLNELLAKEQEATSGTPMSNDDFIQLQTDIGNTTTVLDELIAKQQDMESNGTAFTGQYSASVADLESQLTGASNAVSLAVNTMNETPVDIDTGDTPSKLDEIRSKAEEVASSLVKMVGSGIVNGFKSLKSNLSKIKSTLTSIGDTASNKVSKGFSTILKYGFGIRSLYVLFRRLKEAIKDSFTELQNSGAFYETTRANIEALKSSLTTLKYQFGAAFEPIFNAVAPALQTLINYLIAAMNTLSAFIAKITGKSTYSKAVASTADIASNTGSAADSAKELNKQLQGFDELNNLTSNSGGSGGSGGGSSDSSGVTYEEASVDSALSSFWSSLADDIKNGDWKKVGTTISDKLSEAMESIPWDTIYSKAKNFGTNLANFLNGLITPRLFSNLGTTLANAINTAFTFLNSFGKTFDWTNFGTSIGTGITSFFKNADFSLWGDTVHTWVAGILDAGIALLKSTDFKEIGTKLAAFLNGLQIGDIAKKLAIFALNLVSGISQAITSLWSNSDVSTKIGLAIAGLFAAAKLTGLSSKLASAVGTYLVSNPIVVAKAAIAVATFTVTFKAAKFVFQNIAEDFDKELASYYENFTWTDFVETILSPDGSGIDWTAIKNAWVDMCSDYFEPLFEEIDSWVDIGKNIIEGIKEGVEDKLKTISTWVKTTFNKIVTAVKDFFGIKSPSKVFEEIGGYMIDGLKNGLKNGVTKIKNWIKTNVTDKIKGFFNGIKTITISIAGKVLSSFTDAKAKWDDFKDKTAELVASAKEKVNGAIKNLKEQWDNFPVDVKKLWTEAKEKAGDTIEKIKTTWNNWTNTTKQLWTTAQEKADGLIKTIQDKWNKWRNTDDTKTLKANATDGGTIATTKKDWTDWVAVKNDTKTLNVALNKSSNDKGETFDSLYNTWTTMQKGAKADIAIRIKKGDAGQGSWDKLEKRWNDIKDGATGTMTIKATDTNNTLSNAAKNWEYIKGNGNANMNITFSNSFTGQLQDAWNSMVREVKKALTSTGNSTKSVPTEIHFAKGGIIGANGIVQNIPQFATGTLDALKHGTIFAAGENGPEVMGHINGKTEILNRSQLASTMFQAVTNGMRQFKNAQMVQPPKLAFANGAVASYNGGTSSNNDALIAEQNRLLNSIDQHLQVLETKDVSISSRDVFNANRSEANNYFNRTGNSPFLF